MNILEHNSGVNWVEYKIEYKEREYSVGIKDEDGILNTFIKYPYNYMEVIKTNPQNTFSLIQIREVDPSIQLFDLYHYKALIEMLERMHKTIKKHLK